MRNFENKMLSAKVRFLRQAKVLEIPITLIYSEFDDEELTVLVFGEDADENVRVCVDFPIGTRAWTLDLKRELDELFQRGLHDRH